MSDALRRCRRHPTGRSQPQDPHQLESGALPGEPGRRKRVFEFPILRDADGEMRAPRRLEPAAERRAVRARLKDCADPLEPSASRLPCRRRR